jgi:hypothetical protein
VADGISSIPLDFTTNRLASLTPARQDGTTGAVAGGSSAVSVLSSYNNLANPNLASGQSSSSVLGAFTYNSSLFPEMPTQQSQLVQQITTTATQRFTDEQTQIQDTYQQKADSITALTDQWIKVKASVYNAQASVDQGNKSIDNVNQTLLTLRGVISNAEQDPAFNAKSFNTDLNSINSEADRLGQALNLVGSINRVDYTRNTVEYRNDLSTGTSTLQGGYIGSDYRIMASDGTVWVPDLTAGTLTHYSELQGVAKKVTVTEGSKSIQLNETATNQNGIELVSYDDNTKAITLKITVNPSDPPTTVTGTLQQTGIGLMPAWFYDNLQTDAGRTRAHAAVNNAIAQLGLGRAAVQTAANTVATDTRRVDGALDELNKKNSSAQLDQLQSLQDLQLKYNQQVQAMINNLNQLSSQQQNYLDAFASQISDDPFLNVTI